MADSSEQYKIAQFTSAMELANAAAFDVAVFSQQRPDDAGSSIEQAVASRAEYERLAALGGQIFGLVEKGTEGQPDGGRIRALGAIAMQADPEAREPILRRMSADTSYMWVLATDPACRGQGLGGLVLDEAIARAIGDNKTRMVSTVHPSNVSMDMFLKRGFLGVALQDVYYFLPGNDGMRLIVLRDSLSDPSWCHEQAGTDKNYVSAPKRALHEADSQSQAYRDFAAMLEIGYCVSGVRRFADDPASIAFEFSRYGGDPAAIPNLLYPYTTLTEGYDAAIGNERRALWQQVTGFSLSILDRAGTGHTARAIFQGQFLPLTAQFRWLFVDWLKLYHQHIQAVVDGGAEPGMPTQQIAGNRMHMMHIETLQESFLAQENEWLRIGIRSLPADNELRIACETQLAPVMWSGDKSEYYRALGTQNVAVYRLLTGTPEERQLAAMFPALPTPRIAGNDALTHMSRFNRLAHLVRLPDLL